MRVLSAEERDAIRKRLSGLAEPVRLLFFTQTFGAPETVAQTKQILDEVRSLNDLIAVEEVNFVLEKDRAEKFGVEGIPAIAILRGEHDTRMRFLGAPTGYEFMSLIEAIIVAGTNEPGLSDESRSLIDGVTEPLDIKVFVTPTCPHCPRAVTLAHKIAMSHTLITATCVEATEFLELSRQYRVTGVPKTIVNRTIEILGVLPETDYVRGVLGLSEAETSGANP